MSKNQHLTISPDLTKLIKNSFENIILHCKYQQINSINIAEQQILFIRSLLEQLLLSSQQQEKICSLQPKTLRRLQHTFDYLGQKLHAHWQVESIAKHMSVSVPHLHRLSQAHFQMSPMKKLTQLRMEKAKCLLQDTDYSIEDIAELVGYQEASNFSARYKKYWNKTPRDTRK